MPKKNGDIDTIKSDLLLEDLLRELPNQISTISLIDDTEAKEKRDVALTKLIQEAAKIIKINRESQHPDSNVELSGYEYLGLAFYYGGDLERAKQAYGRAVVLVQRNKHLKKMAYTVYAGMAVVLSGLGNDTEAITSATLAIGIAPEILGAHLIRSRAHYKKDNLDDAVKDIQEEKRLCIIQRKEIPLVYAYHGDILKALANKEPHEEYQIATRKEANEKYEKALNLLKIKRERGLKFTVHDYMAGIIAEKGLNRRPDHRRQDYRSKALDLKILPNKLMDTL